LTDALGSTRTKTNGSGLALARFDYEPFGAEIGRHGSGGDGLRQRFTGKERDAESGLDYFGARYLAGGQGRFTSADEPFADQQAEDPQSWNLFSHVGNNPLSYVDPGGRGKIKAIRAVIQRLQVGFEQIVIRHEGGSIGFKEAKERLAKGGDVIFEGEATASRAAGKDAIRHNAHTSTAGAEALPHYHPVNSRGKKTRGHGFIRQPERIVIPGAALGVTLFGDNLLGQTADVLNPLSDAQSVVDILDRSVIPAMFRFTSEHLLYPNRPPERSKHEKKMKPHIETKLCDSDGINCVGGQK